MSAVVISLVGCIDELSKATLDDYVKDGFTVVFTVGDASFNDNEVLSLVGATAIEGAFRCDAAVKVIVVKDLDAIEKLRVVIPDMLGDSKLLASMMPPTEIELLPNEVFVLDVDRRGKVVASETSAVSIVTFSSTGTEGSRRQQ